MFILLSNLIPKTLISLINKTKSNQKLIYHRKIFLIFREPYRKLVKLNYKLKISFNLICNDENKNN